MRVVARGHRSRYRLREVVKIRGVASLERIKTDSVRLDDTWRARQE